MEGARGGASYSAAPDGGRVSGIRSAPERAGYTPPDVVGRSRATLAQPDIHEAERSSRSPCCSPGAAARRRASRAPGRRRAGRRDARRPVRRGRGPAPGGRPRRGARPFEAALAQDPDRLSALNDLAVSYVLEGHGDAARRLLDEVVATGSVAEQQAALVNLGELYAARGLRLRGEGLPRHRPQPRSAAARAALRARAPRRRARRARGRARVAARGAPARRRGCGARGARLRLPRGAGAPRGARRRGRPAIPPRATGGGSSPAAAFAALASAAERHLAGE